MAYLVNLLSYLRKFFAFPKNLDLEKMGGC